MKTARAISFLLVLIMASAAAVQKPKTFNAKVQEISAAAGLKQTVDSLVQKQTSPVWIGYRFPTVGGEHTMCCFESIDELKSTNTRCCLGCKLEAEKSSFSGSLSDCSPLEAPPYAFVLLRAADRQVSKVRVYTADCNLDAGGLPLYWLEDVKPEQSVEFLTAMATSTENEDGGHKKDGAHRTVMAIALHDTPAADAALEKLLQPSQRQGLREDVVFWLGNQRGKKGLELLRKYAINDQDDRMREKATFALSQSKEPDAIKELVKMAHYDPSAHVRGQALFWMAQIGGRKEAEQITRAIDDDPETEVKKRAVFALSQMHDADGVQLLINVAKSNKNPAVRKQALFWLGQSNDPRALAYIEEIVTK